MSAAASLLAVLGRFKREDVVHAVPALAFDLAHAAPALDVPPAIAEIVRAWMRERKLTATSSTGDVVQALEATYRAQPIAQELKLALNEVLRSFASGDAGRGFRSFLDDKAVPSTAALAAVQKPAPPGAHKANPLARFALKVPGEE